MQFETLDELLKRSAEEFDKKNPSLKDDYLYERMQKSYQFGVLQACYSFLLNAYEKTQKDALR